MTSMRSLRGEEGLNPLECGAKRYRDKEYESAILAFNEAVKISTGHMLVTALDHRAATYEKMKDYKKALKDAKAMIEEQPACSKGYLRSGKILELWEKPALALQIYELGLKRVKIGEDEKRMMLQSMFSKLRRKQNPEETFDPLVMLPTELAEMVTQYLDMRTRVLCLCVSKPWKKFLESSPKLWTNFDIRNAKRAVTLKSLKAFLQRANGSVDRAYICLYSTSGGFDGTRFKYLLKHSKKLEYLELVRGGFIGETLTDALPHTSSLKTLIVQNSLVMLPYIKSILKLCPQIVTAGFGHVKYKPPAGGGRSAIDGEWPRCESLEKLQISCKDTESRFPRHVLEAIIAATPNMKHAYLDSWIVDEILGVSIRFDTGWPLLETLDLTSTRLRSMPYLPPNLKHFYISHNRSLRDLWPADAGPHCNILPNLEAYSGSGISAEASFVDSFVRAGIESGTLKTLHISDANYGVGYGHATCESLENLSITNMLWDEAELELFIDSFPNVKHVDLSMTNATGTLIRKLLTRKGSKVQWLRLHQCPRMSFDTLAYVRNMGVALNIKQIPPLLGRTVC